MTMKMEDNVIAVGLQRFVILIGIKEHFVEIMFN